jgi:Zn-dependent protease with chaperone function
VFAASLPLAWYEEFALEHQFGLSTQTLGGWALDSFKGLVFSVAAVAVVPVLWLAWRAVERSPRGWWLWLAAGTLPVALAATLLQPLVFDPLFNRFTPLRDASLRAGILELGARAGIPGRDVYEVDMSARTRKVNAYVNGFGASQRIVLWDTTLEQLERDEILFVMGHEMGHYVLHHIWKGLLATSLGAFAAFALTAAMVHGLLRRFAARWGVRGVHDLAAMPLVIAALTLVSFTGQPVVNAVSRHMEHESDIYGLEITRDNDAAARAFLKLATHNRSDPEPRPWVRFLFYTHPPLAERIVFAQGYRPWERGEPNRLYRGR